MLWEVALAPRRAIFSKFPLRRRKNCKSDAQVRTVGPDERYVRVILQESAGNFSKVSGGLIFVAEKVDSDVLCALQRSEVHRRETEPQPRPPRAVAS